MTDLNSTEKKVTEIIREAGALVTNYFNSQDFLHHEKSEIDIVTQVDLEIDSFLQKELKKAFPDSQFLTEETAPKDFSSFKNTKNLWVIDPIDGTSNFARHNSNFAISIALVDASETQLGVMYNPIEKNLYYAQKDKDHALLNNTPITVSKTQQLAKAVVACDWSWNLEKRKVTMQFLEQVNQKVRQIKCMGSTVCDMAHLASGHTDVHMVPGVNPWDVAAVSLLVKKAGGTITKPTGEPWNIFDSDLVATNGLLHDQILSLLKPS